MHTASVLLRNTVFLNPNLKSSTRFARNVSKIASHHKPVERKIILNSGLSRSFRASSFGWSNLPGVRQSAARLYSTNRDEPPEEDPEGKIDSPLFASQLPATVAVPEVWPQVPVIAINRNPVFPRFIKLIEVHFFF